MLTAMENCMTNSLQYMFVGSGGARTHDRCVISTVLYQLSYRTSFYKLLDTNV